MTLSQRITMIAFALLTGLNVQQATASEIQFQIQIATSDLQNAENVRSQAELTKPAKKKRR